MITHDLKQAVIDRAVLIATRQAINGRPCRVLHIPCQYPSEDPIGRFVIQEYKNISDSEAQPWE